MSHSPDRNAELLGIAVAIGLALLISATPYYSFEAAPAGVALAALAIPALLLSCITIPTALALSERGLI